MGIMLSEFKIYAKITLYKTYIKSYYVVQPSSRCSINRLLLLLQSTIMLFINIPLSILYYVLKIIAPHHSSNIIKKIYLPYSLLLKLSNIINVWPCPGLRLNNMGERDPSWVFMNANGTHKVLSLVLNVIKVFTELR